MHRSRPGFIPRPLLHKAQLSERRARSAEVLLADSIVAARLGDFTVVATSRAMEAAPLVEAGAVVVAAAVVLDVAIKKVGD